MEAVEIRQRVFDVVIQVKGFPGNVLFERYICLEHWDAICNKLGKSWNTIHNYHRTGLEAVAAIIGEA